jgi:monoamine oxidase
MIVPLRHGRSAHRSRLRRKDAAGDADPLWWRLAHLESGREDLGGHEENRGAGAGTPLHIIGESWSTNQGWVEGALETAEDVVSTLTRIPAT